MKSLNISDTTEESICKQTEEMDQDAAKKMNGVSDSVVPDNEQQIDEQEEVNGDGLDVGAGEEQMEVDEGETISDIVDIAEQKFVEETDQADGGQSEEDQIQDVGETEDSTVDGVAVPEDSSLEEGVKIVNSTTIDVPECEWSKDDVCESADTTQEDDLSESLVNGTERDESTPNEGESSVHITDVDSTSAAMEGTTDVGESESVLVGDVDVDNKVTDIVEEESERTNVDSDCSRVEPSDDGPVKDSESAMVIDSECSVSNQDAVGARESEDVDDGIEGDPDGNVVEDVADSPRPLVMDIDTNKTESSNVEVSYVDTDDENVDDPSPCNSPTPEQTPAASDADDECSRKLEDSDSSTTGRGKRTASTEDEGDNAKSAKKMKLVKDHLDESINRVAAHKTLPISFTRCMKGTLGKLTRDDLEELCLIKFCEVVTERGELGHLRRRNQTLEEDMKKWKLKHQVLTKQMKDMDMIMRKYIADVREQSQSPSFTVAKPMRVTRSVGLQVSVSINRNNNQNQLSPQNKKTPNNNNNMINNRMIPPSPASKTLLTSGGNKNQLHPPLRYPPANNLNQISNIMKPVSNNQIRNLGAPLLHQHGQGKQVAQPGAMMKMSQKLPLQRQQTDSKLIDLTGDEDKPNNLLTKTNMLMPRQLSQQDSSLKQQVAYMFPTSNSPAGTRQVVIATPTSAPGGGARQILPPLIYKGGAFVQNQQAVRCQTANQIYVRPQQQQQQQQQPQQGVVMGQLRQVFRNKHPAPLPPTPMVQASKPGWKFMPPKPSLKISRSSSGIVLSWNMSMTNDYETIDSYQLYAYQETKAPPQACLWKKVGDVKALPLPMACTLSQFVAGHRYHFAVRAVDIHSRLGPFSLPGNILLAK